jgi:hypothetical protein
MVAFEPKPHDDEVDRFDVCIPNASANTMLTYCNMVQLLSLSSVVSKMRASLFKPNCALGKLTSTMSSPADDSPCFLRS